MTRPRRETLTASGSRVPLAIAALTMLGALACLGLPRAGAAVAVQGKIAEIRVEGIAGITREQVLAKIVSREGRDLNEAQVEADRQSLLKANWFSDVKTYCDKDPKGKGLILFFEVVEMPLLREVEFRGRTKVRQKDIEENTGLKKGARADHMKNALAVNSIKNLYREKGYDLAEVNLIEGGKPGDTRAIFEIFEGPKCQVGGITFTGNTFVSDATLYTKISSRTKILGFGGKFSREDVESDTIKLRDYYSGQGFFEVKVTPVIKQGPEVGDYRIEFVIWEGIQFKVRNLSFEGNKLIATAKLRDGLIMHSGQPFSDTFKEADKKALDGKYGEIGCIDAVVEAELKYTDTPGVVDINYRFDEGQPYLMGRFIVRGNERTRDKVLRREAEMAGLVPGEPLNMRRMDTYKRRIGNLRYFVMTPDMGGKPVEVKVANQRSSPYGDNAAPNDIVVQTRLQNPGPDDAPPAPAAGNPALIEPRPIAPPAEGGGPGQPFGLGGAFDPAPDSLPPINVPAGPPPPELPVVPPPADRRTRTPPLGANEPVDFPNMPGMNATDVGPDRNEPFPNRAYADIVTQVDEAPTGRLMFGVGASSFQGLTGNFILHESNFDITAIPKSWNELFSGQAFRGGGQDFRIDLMPGILINRAVVSFRDPYLFDLPIGFGASAYAFNRVFADWTERREGGRFSLGRQFGVQTYADVSFRIEDIDFYSFRYPAPASYLAAAGHSTLASIRPSLRFDNRNDPFAASKGQYLEFAFEQGWGTFTFPKATVEGRQYFTLGSRPDGTGKRTLTTRGFFGVTGRDTPVYERFFAGDFRSMRGFAYRGVGPHELGVNVGGIMTAIGSVEYQFPWLANDKLQQVFFCDFGTVEANYTFTTFRAAIGTGVRIYLPQQMFGPLPLAFDLAFPVAKGPQDHTRNFTFFIGAFW